MAGVIYFIRCETNQMTKIGHTAGSPVERLRRLRCGSPAPLRPVALLRGNVETERRWHRRFLTSWSHGEWFRPSPELDAAIAAEAEPWDAGDSGNSYPPISILDRPEPISGIGWATNTTMSDGTESGTVLEWAVKLGISVGSIRTRLRLGHSFGEIVEYGRSFGRPGKVGLDGFEIRKPMPKRAVRRR
jgi:hypothetical protein